MSHCVSVGIKEKWLREEMSSFKWYEVKQREILRRYSRAEKLDMKNSLKRNERRREKEKVWLGLD